MADTEASPSLAQTNIINPQGEMVSVSQDQLSDALKYGYRLPTPEELQTSQEQTQYGEGLGNSLKAMAAGGARSASFGLSDQFLTKSGLVNPETLSNLAKYNPGATTAGEVGGVAAGLLAPEFELAGATGEAAQGVGKASELLNPVKGVSRLGEAVKDAATPLGEGAANLLTNAESSPVFHGLISKAISSGMGSAVEGAAYGLGQSVSEDALGDPDALGEKLLSHVGYGALLGGALGSAITAGEIGIPKVVSSAKSALENVFHVASGEAGEVGLLGKGYAKVASFVSGKPEESILQALEKRKLSLTTPEERLAQSEKFADALDEQHHQIEKALKTTYKDIKPEELEATLAGMNPERAALETEKVNQALNESIKTMEERPAIFPARVPAKLRELQADFQNQLSENATAAEHFSNLNELKQNIDGQFRLYKKTPTPEYADAARELGNLRATLKNNLENEDVWGQAGARQSAFNDAANRYYTAKEAFQKKFMLKAPSRTGAPVFEIAPSKVSAFFSKIGTGEGDLRSQILHEYIDSSSNLLDQIEKTYQSVPERSFDKQSLGSLLTKNQEVSESAIEQARFNRLMNQIGSGSHNTSLMEGGALLAGIHSHPAIGGAIETWNMLRAPNLAIQRLAKLEQMSQSVTRAIGKASQAVFTGAKNAVEPFSGFVGSRLGQEAHASANEKIKDLNSNPEKMIHTLDQATQTLYTVAPKTSDSIQQSAIRANAFLKSKLPVMPPQKPFSPKYTPSKGEISKFNRFYSVVENPMEALSQVSAGTLTPDTIETLSTVYPKLYGEMKSNVMEELTNYLSKKKKEPLSYAKKMSLSLFLGEDLDHTMAPESIAQTQVALTKLGKGPADLPGQGGGAPAQPLGTGKPITVSQRSLTPGQKSSQRDA